MASLELVVYKNQVSDIQQVAGTCRQQPSTMRMMGQVCLQLLPPLPTFVVLLEKRWVLLYIRDEPGPQTVGSLTF